MTQKRTQRCNDIGAMLTSQNIDEKIQSIKIYPEGGSVQFWVTTRTFPPGEPGSPDCPPNDRQSLQYLTPSEAMALAKGLERSAIAALKEESA
jgi:hypothetical protein